jgi:6-phosphogluconolactonase (cycloisomerase 2 family)
VRSTPLAVAATCCLALFAGRASAQSPREFLYTTNYGADTITGFRMDAVTGLLTELPGSPFPATVNVEDLAIDPTNRFLYTTSVKGLVAGYRIDPDSGALTPVPGSPYALGHDGLNILVHPSGRFVYSTDQILGAVLGLSIDPVTGALSPLPGSPFDTGFAATGLVIEPAGRFLYAAGGQFTSELRGFQVDPATGVLAALPAGPPIGGNVWDLAIDPSGRYVYGSSLDDDAVYAYALDAPTGALGPLPGAPYPANASPEAVAVERSGRYVYVSTAGTGSGISVYARDPGTGILTYFFDDPLPGPDDMVFDPFHRFLYVTLRGPSLLIRYDIDPETGLPAELSGLYDTDFAPSGIAVTNFQSTQPPALWVSDVSVDEEDGLATFTIVAVPPSAAPITVTYATLPGTAEAGADYAPVSGTLTFAPGIAGRTVSVPIVNDTRDEDDETFSLRLSGASVPLGDGEAVATISDDDPFPVLNGGAVTVIETDTSMGFAVVVSPPSGKTVQVAYTTVDGTATAGSDYVPVSGVLTFPPGVISRPIVTAAFSDRIHEANETFTVVLSAPVNATVASHGRGTINDDDGPGLSVADVVATERTAGTMAARFTVSLSPAGAAPVTVGWATADGTATAGSDYVAASGTLTFAPGTTSQPVDVIVDADGLVEGMETFTVALSGAVGAPIAYGSAEARVLDPPSGADFDRDGRSDLVWRHDTAGQNVFWYMNGADLVAGTFTTPPVLADAGWTIAGTSDFNADGRPDLLWRHGGSGENVLWYMNGSVLTGGTFLTPASLPDVRWRVVGTGDVDVDGRPDLFWRHAVSGEVVVWLMNGSALASGGFLTPRAFTDVQWQAAGTGDFNGDGRADILWRHGVSGQNAVWFLDGPRLRGGTFLDPPALEDPSWRIVATADYDSDGQVDIVWRHTVSGQNAVWFMNGTTLAGGTFTNPSALPDPGWKIVGPR